MNVSRAKQLPAMTEGMYRGIWSVLCLALCVTATQAQEPAAPGETPWRFSAECRMITVSRAVALPLLARYGEPGLGEEVWQQTERLLASGEATLAADLILSGRAGQNAITSSTDSIPYPLSYAPLHAPDRLPATDPIGALNAWPLLGAPPADFNQTQAGETLEMTVAPRADGRLLQVEFRASHEHIQRWQKYDYAEAANGKRLSVTAPIFEKMQTSLTTDFRNGEKLLVGAHALPAPEKGFELFLLEVRAAPARNVEPGNRSEQR